MKKFFIAIVALAAAVSCSNDDIISIDRQAIGFGNPFVENSVRADYSDGKTLGAFTVYGTVTSKSNSNSVALFGGNGANVTGSVGATAWNCTETEYWVPNCTYAFQAVADGVINNGAITVSVGNGDLDLLYAEKSAETNENAVPTGVNLNGVVEFNFTHLMSKVGFSFVNGSANTAYGYNITAVSFKGYDSKGTYTIGTGWDTALTASDTALNFGTGNVTHQIIPGKQTLNITVAYDILYHGTKISATSVTKPLTYKFAQSTNYNIAVTIPAPGDEIKFTTTTVSEWTNAGSDIPLNFN